MFLTDRSRAISFQTCPRSRWYAYHWGRTGLQPAGVRPELLTGSTVHLGLEYLLRGLTPEEAVARATADWQRSLEGRPVLEGARDHLELAQALIYAWAYEGMPQLLDAYEVLAVEEEINVPLSDRVMWMARPDGVLRSRHDGGIYVLSFKTAPQYSRRHQADNLVDMQGLSESWAVREKYGEAPRGVQYVYLLKGRNDASGLPASFLTRPWRNARGDLRWRYESIDPLTGQVARLGRQWTRSRISDQMPLFQWVEMLRDWEPDLDNLRPLETVIVQPAPVWRRAAALTDWQAQIARQEDSLRYRLDCLPLYGDDAHGHGLNLHFPQHLRSCAWPSRCPFVSICHEGASPEDLLAEGQMLARTPNHAFERETIEEEVYG